MTAAFGWAALAVGGSVLALVAAAFAIGARTGRHSVMDVAWGAGIAVAAVASFMASAGQGAPARRWLLLVAASAWGYRLAWHVAVRTRGAGEDPRYRDLLVPPGTAGRPGPARGPGPDRDRPAGRSLACSWLLFDTTWPPDGSPTHRNGRR